MRSSELHHFVSGYGSPVESTSKYFELFALFIFFIGIFSTQFVISTMMGYAFAVIGYGVLVLYLAIYGKLILSGDKTVVVATCLLVLIFSVSSILTPSTPGLPRLMVFSTIIFINLFLIPNSIRRTHFYGLLTRLTTALVVIGLPAVYLGQFGPISSYPVFSPPLGSPIPLYGLTSLFVNPNAMGAAATFGALAGLWEYFSGRSRISLLFFAANSLGVYLAKGRAAMLSFGVALAIILTYQFRGRNDIGILSIAGLLAAPTVAAIILGILPGPGPIKSINLNNREHLWSAAYRAFLDRPILGWGIGNVRTAMVPYIDIGYLEGSGPHTSYIRMFAASGVIGGVAYLYLNLKALYNRIKTATTTFDITEYSMIVAALIIQTFGGNSLFGLAMVSVIPAIIIGYGQNTLFRKSSHQQMNTKSSERPM